MKKEYKIQKKKTLGRTIADITFKVLVVIAVLLFTYILYDKADFSTTNVAYSAPKSKPTNSVPSELKWFEHFKGVENVPDKKQEEKKKSGGTGFQYQGFGK